MINEERTLKDFKYTSNMLKLQSCKYVWAICIMCGKERKIQFRSYNNSKTQICYTCGHKNKHLTEEHKKNISKSNIGRVQSKETRAKISKSLTGKHRSEETKLKISKNMPDMSGVNNPNYGKIASAETRLKQSNAHMGIKNYNYGKSIPEETLRRRSATSQNIPYEEWTEYVTDSPYCPNFNEKCRESNREKYGRRCFLCNKPEKFNIDKNGIQRKLSVHHVDMNKQQGCDGHVWKLIPLCMKCHTLKNTITMMNYIEYILNNSV